MSTSDQPVDPALPDDLEAEEPEMWSRERVVTGWAQLWNVPNLLTLLRILLIPVFWYLLMYDGGQNAGTRLAATLLFIVASITDWLDGYLARRQGLVTTFGKIADPLADKALTGVALIGLSVLGELWWWVTILIILREVGVTVVRFVVLKHGVIPASRGGKAKTVFQMLGIVLFLLPIDSDMTVLWWTRNAVMAIAVLLTLATGVDYVDKAYRTRRDSKADKAARAERRARRVSALASAGSAPDAPSVDSTMPAAPAPEAEGSEAHSPPSPAPERSDPGT